MAVKKPTGKSKPSAGQGRGGSKKSHFAGGKSQVKKPMNTKAKTATVGNPGGKGFAPREAAKDCGSTRTPYDKQATGHVSGGK